MYGDGVVYTHKGGWVPTYELELKEGEVTPAAPDTSLWLDTRCMRL